MSYNREIAVGIIAGVILIFTAWAWGGVVLWTQWVTAGLGLLALAFALLPSSREKWQSRSLRWRLSVALLGGLTLFLVAAIRRLLELRDRRAATLELIPNAELPSLGFNDWGYHPMLLGLGVALLLALLAGLARESGARRRLLRFPPFWLGLLLFGWIALQSLNPWGKVIQRDLFWTIIPQDHVAWLPSGLAAPFDSNDEPPGMNGWRQLLIFVGPWALLCALCIAVNRQRVFAWLAGLASFNAVAVLVTAHATMRSKELSFLGFKPAWAYHSPFGPFVYRNHGGIYLYVMAALAAALTFYLILRRGERSERGGPHLITALLFAVLCVGAVSTLSIGAMIGAGLLLCAVPVAYYRDIKVRQAVTPVAGGVVLASALVLFACFGGASIITDYGKRLEKKLGDVAAQGADDRAPLRRAAIDQIKSGTPAQLVAGWGAGSYRWTAPNFLIRQPEFRSAKGELLARANYAHSDWLQMTVEWGLFGATLAGLALLWVLRLILLGLAGRSAVACLLSVLLGFVLLHAAIDFVFYFTALSLPLVFCVSWLGLANRNHGDAFAR